MATIEKPNGRTTQRKAGASKKVATRKKGAKTTRKKKVDIVSPPETVAYVTVAKGNTRQTGDHEFDKTDIWLTVPVDKAGKILVDLKKVKAAFEEVKDWVVEEMDAEFKRVSDGMVSPAVAALVGDQPAGAPTLPWDIQPDTGSPGDVAMAGSPPIEGQVILAGEEASQSPIPSAPAPMKMDPGVGGTAPVMITNPGVGGGAGLPPGTVPQEQPLFGGEDEGEALPTDLPAGSDDWKAFLGIA